MRMANCWRDISSEKITAGISDNVAALRTISRAKAVLPMLGRPAMMIRSDRCSPEVI